MCIYKKAVNFVQSYMKSLPRPSEFPTSIYVPSFFDEAEEREEVEGK